MDRTLISVDTARLYTQFRRDRGEASLRDVIQVAWWAMQYTAGVIDAPRVAEQALTRFRGQSERWLIEQTEGWFEEYVLPEVQKAGRDAVQRHKSEGHVVGIATGATIYAAGPLARELDIDLVICTELEVDSGGLFTGRWSRRCATPRASSNARAARRSASASRSKSPTSTRTASRTCR